MQLKNDNASLDLLCNTIDAFYIKHGKRDFIGFDMLYPSDNDLDEYYYRFLMNRKHVIEYKIAKERGTLIGVVSLAIGPHYFYPFDFWDYENSQRFDLDPTTEAIHRNLLLMDEFLGYK